MSCLALCTSLVLASGFSATQAMAQTAPKITPQTTLKTAPPTPTQTAPQTTPRTKNRAADQTGAAKIASNLKTYKHADLTTAIWLRQFSAEDQGERGTCSVFAVAFLIAFMHPFEHKTHPSPWPEASVEFLNWAANEATQTHEDGAFFDDIANGYIHYGALHNSYWHYDDRATGFNPDRKVSVEERKIALSERKLEPHMIRYNDGTYGLTDAEVQTIKDYLDKGIPVAAGFRLSETMTTIDITAKACSHCDPAKALAWNTIEDLNDVGGHSMAIVGYQDGPPGPDGGGYFIVRNSWGSSDPLYFTDAFIKANIADVIVFTRIDNGNGPPQPNKDMSIRVSTAFRLPVASPALVAKVSSISQAAVTAKPNGRGALSLHSLTFPA